MTNTIDYNTLSKAELITLLEKRDTDIATLTVDNTTLKEDKQKDIVKIQELDKQLVECQNRVPVIDTAEQLIDALLDLPDEEIEVLPVLLRTTDSGIEAYAAFNYGMLSSLEQSDMNAN
jgi:hypothetical protein